jgi:hypothetical protein
MMPPTYHHAHLLRLSLSNLFPRLVQYEVPVTEEVYTGQSSAYCTEGKNSCTGAGRVSSECVLPT